MDRLEEAFGKQVRRAVPLARYTAARVGGPADVLLEVRTANELAQAVTLLWRENLDYVLLGGGSNVLVSDAGIRGVVLLNRARKVRFDDSAHPPTVWAEFGRKFGPGCQAGCPARSCWPGVGGWHPRNCGRSGLRQCWRTRQRYGRQPARGRNLAMHGDEASTGTCPGAMGHGGISALLP